MTTATDERERVVFRVYGQGDVIALFPDSKGQADSTPYHVTCYQHVGQHGAADYNYVIAYTRPAKPTEYRELLEELQRIGYRLRVVQRARV